MHSWVIVWGFLQPEATKQQKPTLTFKMPIGQSHNHVLGRLHLAVVFLNVLFKMLTPE